MPEGDFISPEGNICGRHKGLLHYTVGQRKGLGIALGRPVFIKSMDPRTNRIYLGDAGEEFAAGVVLRDCRWIPFDEPTRPIRAGVKIRSMAKEAEAQITPLPNGAAVCCLIYPSVRLHRANPAFFTMRTTSWAADISKAKWNKRQNR